MSGVEGKVGDAPKEDEWDDWYVFFFLRLRSFVFILKKRI